MLGYTFAIFSSVITSTLIMTRGCFSYDPVADLWTLKKWLHIFPNFCFNRVVYMLVDVCSFDGCLQSFEELTDEQVGCITALYVDAVLYMILAVYLNEVVP